MPRGAHLRLVDMKFSTGSKRVVCNVWSDAARQASILARSGKSSGVVMAAKDASRYSSLEKFSDSRLNTPGGRLWPNAAKAANSLRARQGKPAMDYEIRLIKHGDAKPTQTGEDYENSSSQTTAKKLKKLAETKDLNVEEDGGRREDYNPITLDEKNNIVDGNHRHAAAKANGDSHMLAFVPTKKGTGKVTNIPEMYAQLHHSEFSPS
jgi:hypothetical protein